MARWGLIGAGIFLFFIAIIAYYSPISITLAGENFDVTIPQLVAFCESGLGQFAQLSPEMVMVCSEYNTLMLGIYGSGLLGIILMIIGAVKSGGAKEVETHREVEETEEDDDSMEILKKRYAKGEISKEEFEKMKKDLEN